MNARKPPLGLIAWSLLAPFFLVSSAVGTESSILWLDELDLGAMRQDFGKPQARQSVTSQNLAVGGRVFARGVGTHANSSLVLDVRSKASRLEALVGVDDAPKTNPGSVEFIVMGDGKVLWRSGTMRGGTPAKPVAVDLTGVKSLELRATDAGDGIDSDHADWLNARLLATGPLEHLYPPDKKSPQAWNRLSDEQIQRGGRMEEVAPGVWRLRFGEPEKLTPIRFQGHPPCLKEMAALPSSAYLPIKVSAIGFKASGRGTALELPLEPGEQLYGLGMNLKVFQLLGSKKTIRVSDDQGTALGDSHAPVPFYISTRGYGIYVDTARYASFYFGNLDAMRDAPAASKSATAQRPATSTEELYCPREPGAKFVGVDIPSARGVDVYVFSGPELRHAVARYNLFSGGGCLPPMWGLGVWYRALAELGQKEVLGFLQEFRVRHMPCDVFGLEPGWHSQAYPCSFVWGRRYPAPDQLLRQTQRQGYKLNLWEHAFTHTSSPLYQPLLPWSGDYKVWGGLVPDFATAEARRIFADHHVRTLVAKGVSGFKLDECDHQPLSATPWSFPEQTVFPSGLDGEQMHLLIGTLYQRTMGAMYQQRNQRTLGLVRSSVRWRPRSLSVCIAISMRTGTMFGRSPPPALPESSGAPRCETWVRWKNSVAACRRACFRPLRRSTAGISRIRSGSKSTRISITPASSWRTGSKPRPRAGSCSKRGCGCCLTCIPPMLTTVMRACRPRVRW